MDAPTEIDRQPDPVVGVSGARPWVFALVALSVAVWGTRIDNIVADESLDVAGQAWRVALALSFVGLALVVGLRWWRRPGPEGRAWAVEALAWWTIGVWTVRGASIALADHEAAFIIVHLVLAIVSIALAVQVLRSLPGRPAPPS